MVTGCILIGTGTMTKSSLSLQAPYLTVAEEKKLEKNPTSHWEMKVKQHLKKCHEDFEATPILFRAVSDNRKNKVRSPGLWLTSVTVFTFSLHSWQSLEHRCKNGRNALLILSFLPECSSLHKDTPQRWPRLGGGKRKCFLFSPC